MKVAGRGESRASIVEGGGVDWGAGKQIMSACKATRSSLTDRRNDFATRISEARAQRFGV